MKTLVTERLILRPWAIDDLNDFFEYAQNPKVGPNAGWMPHEDKEVSLKILQSFIEKDEVRAVVYKENNKVIGSLGVSCYHYPFNIRSKRVIEKCGFKYEGTLRSASEIFDGSIYDDVCYSIIKNEYFTNII